MMKLVTTANPAKEVGEAISDSINIHDGDVVCLLSGGSALNVVEYITVIADNKRSLSECRTIFMMGDERVSREPKINNSLQLLSKFSDTIVAKNLLVTIPEENETAENFATRIRKSFAENISKLNNIKIIMILGVGADGHTAGIFPLPKESFRTTYKEDAEYVSVSNKSLKIDSRASFTPDFILNTVDQIFGYIIGESKKNILNELNSSKKEIYERPAEVLKLHSNATVYTDIDVDVAN